MSFRDFPEQSAVTELLQRSLERGRLAHAYLFSGSTVAELEAVARTLAKALNCQAPPRRSPAGFSLDSCDQCPVCRRIQEGNHPDVLWLRPESKSRVITIEQVRELLQTIHLKPNEAEFKVAAVVEVDRLNVQAANAFLKTLEEPPPRSVLLLLSTDPSRILETILSRCLRLNFSGEKERFEPSLMVWLREFCQLATQARQGLLAKYQLLGKLLQKLSEQKSEVEEKLTAQSPLQRYEDADPKLREKWEDELSASIEAEYRRRRVNVLLVVETWLRDVWLRTLGVDQLAAFPELTDAAQVVAHRISVQEAVENLGIVERTQRLLASNVQEALALEVALLKLKL